MYHNLCCRIYLWWLGKSSIVEIKVSIFHGWKKTFESSPCISTHTQINLFVLPSCVCLANSYLASLQTHQEPPVSIAFVTLPAQFIPICNPNIIHTHFLSIYHILLQSDPPHFSPRPKTPFFTPSSFIAIQLRISIIIFFSNLRFHIWWAWKRR